ncbi:MAG: efflux RND transporter permease subunit [Verrucomicrobia bacterium]|nr:efflux RND transporter permease subunit [Verrucomicrobiota bacterium]
MINRLIEWSLRNRFLVVCGALLLVALGVRAIYRTPVDAIPDLSENQVIVFADWAGRSPQEVEDQVTYPLSVNLQGLAGVKAVRANSMFGFSLITIVFEDRVDNYFARSRVLERLNLITSQMPVGVVPQLGPDATGLGWVYQYYLHVEPNTAAHASSPSPLGGERAGVRGGSDNSTGTYDLGQLRALQDWFIRYQLNSVQGVAEVGGVGGFVRQYQIEVSSLKLRAAKVPLRDVLEAVERSNLNVGGKVIEENGMEFVVRGIGLVKTTNAVADLESIVLMERDGTPIYLRDVATVQVGGDFRRGALDVDGREVVGGTVVMRTGENAMEVIRRVKEKIAQIQTSLPPGVTIKPFYDRSELIDRTIDTLKHALAEEMILVTLAHIIFLFHFRSILIVTLPLPLSILVSFVLMQQFGISSNIMSLAGIAIAIGVLVDAGIVMTENVIRHCEKAEREKGLRFRETELEREIKDGEVIRIPPPGSSLQLTSAETLHATLAASKQVGRPIFFAMVIIILAFVPVFALSGQEGKLFHPLAFTKTFAMIGSTLLAVTIVPALCAALVRGPFHSEDRNWVMRGLLAIYDPVLDWALRRRKTVMSLAALLLASALVVAFGLPRPWLKTLEQRGWPKLAQHAKGFGKEFMPPLNEGSLLFMPVLLPSTSITEVKRIMAWQDTVIRQTPEVESVAGKLGRAETATDPAPVEMIETTIMLKPEWVKTNRTWLGFLKLPTNVRNPEWRANMTPQKIKEELMERLAKVPGYVPGFLQPIENRVLMISTGIRAQVGVKILGDNLDELQKWAFEVEKVVRTVEGAVGVSPSRVQGKPYLEIEVDRVAMARFGLRAADVLDVVEAGLGGKNVSTTIEGRERYPIQVRLERHEREDIEKLGEVLVATPSGKMVPLGQVAKIRRTVGPSEIASENGRLRVFVQANVNERDIGSFVNDIRARVEKEILPRLPKGMTIEYSGEYENMMRAARTLNLILPAVLLIIFLLLYLVYHSAKEAAHVILAVPFALTGGIFLQHLLGYNFSVAVWVGYIALFGTAIQTGVVMVVYLEEMVAKKKTEREAAGQPFTRDDLIQAIKDGARLRLRPKVMTVATVVASLLPIMWSEQTGSEVMKPLATPVIGGMLSSLVHILVVTPVIFAWLREGELNRRPAATAPPATPQNNNQPA